MTPQTPDQDEMENKKIIHIDTSKEINEFLKNYDMTIGGVLLCEDKLVLLETKNDLKFIRSKQPGCYFIFSNLREDEIPCISKDGYKGYQRSIEKNGEIFRCLYNGKNQKVKERLMQHLFNSHTLLKIKQVNSKNKSLSGTGAMSLESISAKEAEALSVSHRFYPDKQKLKPVEKSLHPGSHRKLGEEGYFINGIDITEEQWVKYKFAICVIETDTELGKILIEEAFAKQNGRPPLCRRHG